MVDVVEVLPLYRGQLGFKHYIAFYGFGELC